MPVYFLAIDGNRVSSPAVTEGLSGKESGNISQATMLLAGNHSISVQAFSGAGTRECKTSDISLNGLFIPKE